MASMHDFSYTYDVHITFVAPTRHRHMWLHSINSVFSNFYRCLLVHVSVAFDVCASCHV